MANEEEKIAEVVVVKPTKVVKPKTVVVEQAEPAKKCEEVAVVQKEEFVPASAEQLISQAIANNVSVDTIERLLAMRRELQTEFAKKEYDKAMSGFQAKCPIIKKTRQVKNKDGSVRYNFAPIEAIVEQVKDILQEFGFSYSINAKTVDSAMVIYCKVTHLAGHSETSEFSVPIDNSAFMNEAQKVASASTFAKRYAFCNAFGILTGEDDDDSVYSGNTATPTATQRPAYNSAPKPQAPNNAPICPDCGEKMAYRTSTRGPFWGCSKYPNCKGIVAVQDVDANGNITKGSSSSSSVADEIVDYR